MANDYESRISQLEEQAAETSANYETVAQQLGYIQQRLSDVTYAFSLKYENGKFYIYIPEGALTINGMMVSISGTTGWVNLGSDSGNVYLNIFKNGTSYSASIGRTKVGSAKYSILMANTIVGGYIAHYVQGGIVLTVDEEVRGSFDIITMDGKSYMFVPLNGTINYGGSNHIIYEGLANSGWMEITNGTYYCWALTTEPWAHITTQDKIKDGEKKFQFKMGSLPT